jgi:transcriptional regulator with XRE-family HTH domain
VENLAVSLGATLRKLRLRKGQSLQQVADAVGASKAHIWEMETGKSRNPSIDLLTRLADHYEVSLASLVGEDPEALERIMEGDPEASRDDQLMRMFRQLRSLETDDREMIHHMIQRMIERRKAAHGDQD